MPRPLHFGVHGEGAAFIWDVAILVKGKHLVTTRRLLKFLLENATLHLYWHFNDKTRYLTPPDIIGVRKHNPPVGRGSKHLGAILHYCRAVTRSVTLVWATGGRERASARVRPH